MGQPPVESDPGPDEVRDEVSVEQDTSSSHPPARPDDPATVDLHFTVMVEQRPPAGYSRRNDLGSPPAGLDDHVDLVRAVDGDTTAGEMVAVRSDLTVPGAFRLPTALLLDPRGPESTPDPAVMTGLVTHLLVDARRQGQVIAATTSSWLGASAEFGPASEACEVEIDPVAARPVHRPEPGTVTTHDPAARPVLELLTEVYERCARLRVGTIRRSSPAWIPHLVATDPDTDPARASATPEVALRHDSTGRVDAFVVYTVNHSDETDPLGEIHDLWGETPAAERALWEHLLGREEVTRWRGARRPAGDPLRLALGDPRAHRTIRRYDELWVRLLDIDVALGTRSYNSCTRAVTLRVTDPLFGGNDGTYRVDSYGSFRSHGSPDLELGIEALSAAYLGGTSFRDLLAAGRITERTSGAATDADVLFEERPTPFCGSDL